ncbi:MAG TPA: NADH-quinone oxidoreductase subunit L [Clostridia bacterium]|nr:NADH-quinone oxidoreductase subunit L [Clostridia bacterium]
MLELAWLIPIFPLIAYTLIIFLTKKSKSISVAVALAGIVASLVISIGVLVETIQKGITMAEPFEVAVKWLRLSAIDKYTGLNIDMGILIDPLSAVMMFVVTSIATLVIIYSVGYMHGDPGFSRYFAYMSLFAFSMLLLVIANNFFEMFFGWELVGLCSYLLIGFWFEKPSAAKAANKAFITNRWGDFGFMLGIILLYINFGTFNFGEISRIIGDGASGVGAAILTLISLLIFAGPMAKSAQFPLHVWLPDAMEGPTPVSSILHAATMVAAGVYLLARGFVLFNESTETLLFIAYIGGITAFIAASFALVQRDIKRILAYSTLSQLGYMVMVIGVGSITAGMFHLTTHAFFKCMLFLGAGSVIHAVHTQDIFEMGGLSKKMPITTWTFIIGALALAGIFPLSGFWSKDEILLATHQAGFTGLYWLATLVAGMTAFYMFRLIFIAFFGEKRTDHHAHESSPWMTVPLIILAFFAVFSGWGLVKMGYGSMVFFGHPHHGEINLGIALISTVFALGGIVLAWLIYYRKIVDTDLMKQRFRPIYNLLWNKLYIDEIYEWLFDKVMLGVAWLCNQCDRKVVDGIADGLGDTVRHTGGWMRFMQTGSLQNYALVIFGAIVIIVLLMATPVLGGVIR